MQVRPAFLYALAVVLAFFLAFNSWRALERIDHSRDVLQHVASTPVTAETRSGSRWQAADFLQETIGAAQKQRIEWVKLATNPADRSRTLTVRGSDAELLAYYEWFEKHAQVRSVTEMEIGKDEAKQSVLQITFDW